MATYVKLICLFAVAMAYMVAADTFEDAVKDVSSGATGAEKEANGFFSDLSSKLDSAYHTAVDKTKEGYSKAKDAVSGAYQSVKEKAKEAYDDYKKPEQ